ncbi:hypothetical protein ABT009_03195 [Streptomyces sp. NPDC002896]|uniref:hypothetical protein n=1 Tax=Streptomyces sp. NPDC002896 TaxID=3154438 RepID=UPI003321EABA
MPEISNNVRNFEQKIGTGGVRVNSSDRFGFLGFPLRKGPGVVTDDVHLADWLTANGVPAATFDGLLSGRDAPPPRAVAVPLD